MAKRRTTLIIFCGFFLIVVISAAIFVSQYFILDRIVLSVLPTKTNYYIGEDFEFSGMKIQVIYKSGRSEFIDVDSSMISGFDSKSPNKALPIFINYQGKITQTTLSIHDYPDYPKTLTGIALHSKPTLLAYKIGWQLDVRGGIIILNYDDGSTESVLLLKEYVSGFDSTLVNDSLELIINYKGMIAAFSVVIEE